MGQFQASILLQSTNIYYYFVFTIILFINIQKAHLRVRYLSYWTAQCYLIDFKRFPATFPLTPLWLHSLGMSGIAGSSEQLEIVSHYFLLWQASTLITVGNLVCCVWLMGFSSSAAFPFMEHKGECSLYKSLLFDFVQTLFHQDQYCDLKWHC